MTDKEAVGFAWEMYILNQDRDWFKMFLHLSEKYEKDNGEAVTFKSSFVIKNERH